MRNISVFASLLLCFLCVLAGKAQTSREYSMEMSARGHELSAICMMETGADGNTVGTIVNEFGVKAFDFTFDGNKAKVLNVMGPLNKWYIRKVLRKDFSFLLRHLPAGKDATEGKRQLTFSPNGDISLVNGKFNISYTFTPMKSEQ